MEKENQSYRHNEKKYSYSLSTHPLPVEDDWTEEA